MKPAGLAYGNLAVVASRHRDWDSVDRLLDAGIAFAKERDLDGDHAYMVAWRSCAALARGRWDEATADATSVLRGLGTPNVVRATALIAIGLLRARRGDPDVWPPLDQSLEIAQVAAELPKLAPLACARAEAAILSGDPERAVAEVSRFSLGALADRWIAGELAAWSTRAGAATDPGGPVPQPFALELAGDFTGAASAWDDLGCPYDAALALAGSNDESSLRRSHDRLQTLGARPAAAIVARRLRERGARDVSRGPRPSTQDNPAGLTTRELDVLRLVAQGLRNAEIADRLFLSAKTVDHHVSAILRKLPARTRAEATASAVRLGIVEAG